MFDGAGAAGVPGVTHPKKNAALLQRADDARVPNSAGPIQEGPKLRDLNLPRNGLVRRCAVYRP